MRNALLLAVLAACVLSAAPASAQATPPLTVPAIEGFRSVLAQGEGQTVTASDLGASQLGTIPSRFTDQQPLYAGVMPKAKTLTEGDIPTYYKDATFGSMPGGVESVTRPRAGVQIFRDKRRAARTSSTTSPASTAASRTSRLTRVRCPRSTPRSARCRRRGRWPTLPPRPCCWSRSSPFQTAERRSTPSSSRPSSGASGATGVAFQQSGNYPLHARHAAVDLPFNGDGSADWQGFDPAAYIFSKLPDGRRPAGFDPKDGYLISWNNKEARGWRKGPREWDNGPVHRALILEHRLLGEKRKGGGKVDLAGLTRAVNVAATTDLRGDELVPWLVRVIGKADAADRRWLSLLRAWHRSGAQRLDVDGDNVYEHSAAVALMDAWWPRLVRGSFEPALGRELFDRVESRVLALDGFGWAWTTHVQKDLRSVLGRRERGRFSRLYCGGPTTRVPLGDQRLLSKLRARCRQMLVTTLRAAVADQQSKRGKDPSEWKVPATCPVTEPAGCDQIVPTTAGAVDTPPFPWQNRGTYHQVIKVRGLLEVDDLEAGQPLRQQLGELAAVADRRVGLEAQQRGTRRIRRAQLVGELVELRRRVRLGVRAERGRALRRAVVLEEPADVGRGAQLATMLIGDAALGEHVAQPRLRHAGAARLRPVAHVDQALDAGRPELGQKLGWEQPLVADGPQRGHSARPQHGRREARGRVLDGESHLPAGGGPAR